MSLSTPRFTPRTLVFGIVGALGLSVAAATVVAVAPWQDRVTLDVDGVLVSARTSADTVDEFLAERDVTVGAEDKVLARNHDVLSDGDAVRVRTAKPLTLVVDGETTTAVSHEVTVAQALTAAGAKPQDGAEVSDDLDDTLDPEGNLVIVSNPKDIVIDADGKKRTVTTTAPTVEDLLAEAKIELGTLDEVNHALWNHVKVDTLLKVTRVEKATRTEELPVDFKVKVEKDSSMLTSDRKVVAAGQKGLDKAQVEVVLADGKVRERTIVSRSTVRPPVDRVVKQGTKKPAPAGGSPVTAGNNVDGGVWDRLAQCESNGNWQINTGNGYYGGLQFSASSWRGVGGSGLPHQNSKAEQIKRGEMLKRSGGWGHWPACSKKLGLR